MIGEVSEEELRADSVNRAVIVLLLAEPGYERCRIRWDDGEQGVVYPGPDITIERQPTTPGEVRRRPS